MYLQAVPRSSRALFPDGNTDFTKDSTYFLQGPNQIILLQGVTGIRRPFLARRL